MNDTRKEGRLPVALLARYREPTMLEPREGECRDVSPGGMFIMTPRPSPRGALIRFECVAESPDEGFRGTGRVVWQRNKTDPRGPAGMGIRFVRLESGSREALQRIVERVQLERQRSRGEPGRRTSSGPPPRVRAAEADTQPVPIFGATGDAAGRDPAAGLRAGTLRGPGGRASDRSTERGPVQRSPLPPAPNPGSPLPPAGPSGGPPPNFASTLISASPPPDHTGIAGGSPARSGWPPRSPESTPEGSRSATPPPLEDPPTIASPVPPADGSQRSDALRERLDRTRRGVGPSGAPSSEKAASSGPPPGRDARKVETVTTAETRPISDKPVQPTLRSPGPAASERLNERTLLGRPSDRPPRPGGVDDLRTPRASAPPKGAAPTLPGTEAHMPSIAPEVVTMPNQAGPALRVPPIDAGAGYELAGNLEPWSSGIGLQWVLAGGVVVAALVWKLFGGAPVPLTDDAITKLASRFDAHAQAMPEEPAAAEAPPPPAESPPEAPYGKSAPDLLPPAPSAGTKPAEPKPIDAPPAGAKSTREAPSAAPPAPSEVAPRQRASAQASAPKPEAPPKAPPNAGPSPGSAPVLIAVRQPPPAPSPEAPIPAATPAAGAQQKSPLDQALDCLAHGDNACVIRALEDKASSERELQLLIATYRAVGSGARADAAIKRYLEAYPNGQHAAEYRRLLERHSSGPQHE